MQSSIHNEYQHAERRQSAGKRPIVNKRNLKCEPRSRRTAAECPNKLTSWIGTARCLQLCVPCLPVTCLTDLKLLILLLLELRLVAKHVAQSEPRWASAPEHPDKRPNVRQGTPLKQPKDCQRFQLPTNREVVAVYKYVGGSGAIPLSSSMGQD